MLFSFLVHVVVEKKKGFMGSCLSAPTSDETENWKPIEVLPRSLFYSGRKHCTVPGAVRVDCSIPAASSDFAEQLATLASNLQTEVAHHRVVHVTSASHGCRAAAAVIGIFLELHTHYGTTTSCVQFLNELDMKHPVFAGREGREWARHVWRAHRERQKPR